MYDYLTHADAAQERIQNFINEADEYRRASQVEQVTGSESKIAAFMRSLSSKVQNALNRRSKYQNNQKLTTNQ